MPVPDITENHLETILKGNYAHIFNKLEDFVDGSSTVPQICNKFMWNTFSDLLHKALESPLENLTRMGLILQVFQHLASFPEQDDGFDVFLEQGFASLMSECLITALHGIRESTEEDINKFFEDVLETITTVSDYSQKAKKILVDAFCDRLLQIVSHANFRRHIKIEAIKSVNSLLDGCTQESRDQLSKKISHQQLVQKIGMLLINAGDYEYQAGIVESLFRLTSKSGRTEYVQNWLPDESLRICFLSIRDSNFEGDCRSFLNILNKRVKGTPRVVSLPCIMAALGTYKLEKPEDGNYTEFWIDFNAGSQRISLFCNQQSEDQQEDEEAMWETVSIWKDSVKFYNVIAEKKGVQNVQIIVMSPVKDLITFGPEDITGNVVCLKFDAKYDVMEALIMTFGIEKCARHSQDNTHASLIASQMSMDTRAGTQGRKVSQAEHPVYVSSETDAMPNGNPVPDDRVFKQPVPPSNTKPPKMLSQESGQSTPVRRPPGDGEGTPRRKCSVPLEPMRTPTMTLASQEELRCSAGRENPVTTRRTVDDKNQVNIQKNQARPTRNENRLNKQPIQAAIQQNSQSYPVEDSDTIPNSQQRTTRRRKVSQSIPYHLPLADVPDAIPSSCPDEKGVVPDSQQSACVPEVAKETSTAPDNQSKPKQQRKEEIAALKDKLSSTDPNYISYPVNKYKVSNTPALSTVSEESPGYRTSLESKRGTPTPKTSTTSIAAIAEEDEEEEKVERPTRSKTLTKPPAPMSPDSTCHPPEPTKKGKGKGAKAAKAQNKVKDKENAKEGTVSSSQESSPVDKSAPAPRRTTRSRKAKQTKEEKRMSPASSRSDKNLAHVVSSLHGLDGSDDEAPVPTSQYIKHIVAEEKMKRSQKGKTEKIDTPKKNKEIQPGTLEEDIEVIPASFEPSAVPAAGSTEKKKQTKKGKSAMLETSQHELEKMKEIIQNTQNSQPQEEDPYVFSDDEEKREQEITVGKFYAKDSADRSKKTSSPKARKTIDKNTNNKQQKLKEAQTQSAAPAKGLPRMSKPSVDTIRKPETAKVTTTPGYDEEFPDLIIENDSFSQYREYEHKFFKSRNSAESSTYGSRTPKQNSSLNTSNKEPKFFKSRARSKENAPNNNSKTEKGSLLFTSPVAGAPKIKNTRANQKKGKNKDTSGAQRGKQTRGKKNTASTDVEYAVPSSPAPEVHVTRLDTRESPLKSPVKLSNIDLTRSPELRPVVAELEKADKKKAKTHQEDKVEEKGPKYMEKEKSGTSSSNFKQNVLEKIKQKMNEAAGDRERLEKTFGSTDKEKLSCATSKKKTVQKHARDADVDIEDSDDQNNEQLVNKWSNMETDHDADVSSNVVDDSVDSFANLCKSIVKEAGGHKLRARKNVTYTEMSESDIYDEQSMTEQRKRPEPKKDTKEREQVERKSRKKHRSVFSETDDGVSCRSEVSWLASTARKKKPQPSKVYEHSPKQRHPFVTKRDDSEEGSDEEDEQNDVDNSMLNESYEPPPPPKPLAADRKKKRKMPKSPQQTEEETSDNEDTYYRGGRKKKAAAGARRPGGDSDKENVPPDISLTKDLPMEAEEPSLKTPAAEISRKRKQRSHHTETTEEQVLDEMPTGSQITRDVTSRLQQILKETSGNVMSSVEKSATKKDSVRTPKERQVGKAISSSFVDDAIERFRHDISTMGPLGDISPINVEEEMLSQKSADDNESNDGFEVKSQLSYASHISSLKTPKTPGQRISFAAEDDVVSQKSGKSGVSHKSAKSAKSITSNKSAKLQKRSVVDLDDNLKSGPSKRRKVDQPVVDKEDDEEDETGSQSSQLQPRRLFTPEQQEEERQRQRKQRKIQQQRQRQSFGAASGDQYADDSDEPVLSPATTSALDLNINTRMLDFEDDDRLASGVSFMIKSFGSEIQKNMLARKQQLQNLTKGVLKNTQEELTLFWVSQTATRERMLEDFKKAIELELSALEKDNDNLREAEDKAMEFFVSQFKVIQGCLVSQKKRLGNLQKIQSAFNEDMGDLEQSQEQQQSKVRDILRKNMKELQKRILLSTQQQEITNVKRTLHSLFT